MRIPLIAKIGGVAAGGLLLAAGLAGPTIASAATNTAATASSSAAPTAGARDRKADHRVIAAAYLAASATVLDMDPKVLAKALHNGAGLSDLAAAKGLNKDQFRDRVVAAIKPTLAADVESGKLTQKEADHFLKRLQSGHLPRWEARKK